MKRSSKSGTFAEIYETGFINGMFEDLIRPTQPISEQESAGVPVRSFLRDENGGQDECP
jgi:hypothetical protein